MLFDLFKADWNERFKEWIMHYGYNAEFSKFMYNLSIIIFAIIACFASYYLLRFLIYRIASILAWKTKYTNVIITLRRHKVFSRVCYFIPVFIINYALSLLSIRSEFLLTAIERLFAATLVLLLILIISSILNVIVDLSQYKKANKSKPIKGLVQFGQVLLYFFGGIICLSVFFSKSPVILITQLSAVSAVLILIFKDTITGLVAGIQISALDIVKIGDWVSMTKYEVDGEVIDVTLTSVRILNWDKSISTVPAYNLIVNESIKNWRGLDEAKARRIARSVNIDMHSVKFCTHEMLEHFKKISYVADYINNTQIGILEFNKDNKIDDSVLVNGRRQTNLGIFRAYMLAYLKHKEEINQKLVVMIRQLHPTENGIPIQVYCYTNTTSLMPFESIQADVFDHLLAVLPFFELNIFQTPSGKDFKEAFNSSKNLNL